MSLEKGATASDAVLRGLKGDNPVQQNGASQNYRGDEAARAKKLGCGKVFRKAGETGMGHWGSIETTEIKSVKPKKGQYLPYLWLGQGEHGPDRTRHL